MRLLLLLALAACGDNIDEHGRSHGLIDQAAEWLTSEGATHGTVYSCDSGAMCLTPEGEPATEEWCWDGEEAELEALLHVDEDGCHPITAGERFFPWLVGCAWCPKSQGCNAHCGCAGCPPPEDG